MSGMWAAAVLLAWTAGAGDAVVLVRATRETSPCVSAAVLASPRWRSFARIETAPPREVGPADLLVASEVELTRALESGAAEPRSDVDLARIPWVFRGAQAAASSSLAGRAVTIPDGPVSYEVRRKLREGGSTVREASDVRGLREASLALVPLSLAGEGPRVEAEGVPPLIARAALAIGAKSPREAQALLAYLTSEDGQRAFATCGRP
jgi:hypothetical protein